MTTNVRQGLHDPGSRARFNWSEAADGAELRRPRASPDVILMDMRMPVMDGLSAIRRLQQEQPDTAVVILTTYNEDELMVQGLRAGARGFLLKDTDRDTLFQTIRAAARGETLLRPEVVSRLLQHSAGQAGSGAGSGVPLTEREIEVLEAAASGARSKEIARQLGISERTVKAHLASIYNKFGVDSGQRPSPWPRSAGICPPDADYSARVYIVSTIIPPMVSSVPRTVLSVSGSPPSSSPISAPKKGEVKAMGITFVSGAPLSAV